MTEPRYLVLDDNGMVTNAVIGFVDLPAVGFIEQTSELTHVGLYWVYDAIADDFINPYGSMPPTAVEEESI
ncbi:hypothetical protein [Agrobacterium genomosp. 2]|uniref:Uncharacterized protein n=1 Tax=Agrobacterium genomosp. 2 str. CFBP 5494 TaxID=1183436 RepID=A0A9W5AYK3_9HYPH|nr:hypothetical protein [Agrobacterium genomosp. 2]CUW87478.1 hypothetical protein AGR2A_Cc120063 [Agrobacterium genomosp. 2 str. CFBP 5494]